jgi:sigma-B regulation protein RsbQ
MSVIRRNNVTITGTGSKPMMFAHGFGCDQNMWRLVVPAFESDYRIILFDHVGSGQSDITAYSPTKYASLKGYAEDVIEICRELDLTGIVFVGHSVSGMIGALAAIKVPELFDRLVMVCPSPCYINEAEYQGGFSRAEIEQLLDFMDSNFLGWASALAPQIMGNPERPELGAELTNSFCRTDPEIAKQFARVTFLSDNRRDLERLRTKSLIIQCSSDVIAPISVGEYVHRNLPGSKLSVLDATGHCPNLSAPEDTAKAIRTFLQE